MTGLRITRSTAALCRAVGLIPSPSLAELRDAGRLSLVDSGDGVPRELALWSAAIEPDPEDAQLKGVDITASDETVDRYGDVIVADGWRLENYARNPVVLVDHNYRVESIVGVGEPRIKGKKLKIRITDDESPENEKAAAVIRLRAQGFLRAVSVGFQPMKWEKILDKDGNWKGSFRYTEQDLLELSWVAVPANPSATLGAESSMPHEAQISALQLSALALKVAALR